MCIRDRRLAAELEDLSYHVSSVESSLRFQIHNITSSLSYIIEEQESIFSEHSARIIGVDIEGGQVCIRMSAALKNYQDGARGVFVLNYTDAQDMTQAIKLSLIHIEMCIRDSINCKNGYRSDYRHIDQYTSRDIYKVCSAVNAVWNCLRDRSGE